MTHQKIVEVGMSGHGFCVDDPSPDVSFSAFHDWSFSTYWHSVLLVANSATDSVSPLFSFLIRGYPFQLVKPGGGERTTNRKNSVDPLANFEDEILFFLDGGQYSFEECQT
jgi:hypothetical protein